MGELFEKLRRRREQVEQGGEKFESIPTKQEAAASGNSKPIDSEVRTNAGQFAPAKPARTNGIDLKSALSRRREQVDDGGETFESKPQASVAECKSTNAGRRVSGPEVGEGFVKGRMKDAVQAVDRVMNSHLSPQGTKFGEEGQPSPRVVGKLRRQGSPGGRRPSGASVTSVEVEPAKPEAAAPDSPSALSPRPTPMREAREAALLSSPKEEAAPPPEMEESPAALPEMKESPVQLPVLEEDAPKGEEQQDEETDEASSIPSPLAAKSGEIEEEPAVDEEDEDEAAAIERADSDVGSLAGEVLPASSVEQPTTHLEQAPVVRVKNNRLQWTVKLGKPLHEVIESQIFALGTYEGLRLRLRPLNNGRCELSLSGPSPRPKNLHIALFMAAGWKKRVPKPWLDFEDMKEVFDVDLSKRVVLMCGFALSRKAGVVLK